MINTGIVVEYNPFHNGHLLHIEKSKKITNGDNIIAIMSGNYVQRGDISIIDKYNKTKMALENGVDMVIELPTLFSTASAEYFAHASVKLLDDTGIIDNICFGTEEGNLESLKTLSNFLINESPEFNKNIKYYLDKGYSFPRARDLALDSIGIDSKPLKSPNNILGIEYLKALKRINSKIIPYTIEREKVGYHEDKIKDNISSATSIRNNIYNNNLNILKNTVPENTLNIWDNLIKDKDISNLDNLSSIFHYILTDIGQENLNQILNMDEGLENRIFNISKDNFLISEIIDKTKSKRYTYTKISRGIIHILLNIEKEYFNHYINNGLSPYIRILGFKKDKSYLVGDIYANSKIPLITNLSGAKDILNAKSMDFLHREIKYTDIYQLSKENKSYKNYEYEMPLIIID